MDYPHLTSKAEERALESTQLSFCKGINLDHIKETVETLLNHIGDNGMFAEYTMHDISHVNGMLDLLEKIIPDDTKYQMTPADWLMTVLSIYFHDLGMFIPKGEFENRLKNKEFLSFKQLILEDDDNKQYIESLEDGDRERFLYQEFVRRNHGERIFDWITTVDKTKLNDELCKIISELLNGLDPTFKADLALICKSHQMTELPDRLKSVDEAYGSKDKEKVNLLYVSVLLRSSDILHMTHDRTPEIEYRIISPQNKISVVEWAKQREVKSIDIHIETDEQGNKNPKIPCHSFEVQAKFSDDKGYFSFKKALVDAINELKKCHEWCEKSRISNNNKYFFPWTNIDTTRVLADGFLNDKLKFEIDQQNILHLLTGHTLYNDSTVVLRELIQNAMDAGRLQDSKRKTKTKYQCRIEIEWNSQSRILRISDNATGMDVNSIQNYLLRVGASKYQSDSFKKDYPDFHSISRFGIGLLTCFMISDDVDIYTLDEEEKQCHLLKIRNLNGEYLMRNDADKSKILEGQHGTTFELKVRNDVDLDNIEQQIRQWIIIPFGKVLLKIDNRDYIQIGYSNVKDAIEDYAKKLNNVDFSSGKYRVYYKSMNGIDIAFLQYYNSYMKTWSLFHYYESDVEVDAPIGISIEGIKVTLETPGMRDRNYLSLVNCTGWNSPTTNVARNALEESPSLVRMYETIYSAYIESFISQIGTLQKDYSLIWATTEVNSLIDSFYYTRPFGFVAYRDILCNVLRDIKCIPIDSGKEVQLFSVNTLPSNITTIDSRAFTAAVSLLKDMNSSDKTAYGLLSELEKNEIKDEKILPMESIARCILHLFYDTYEVNSIDVNVKNRRIRFKWNSKEGKWIHRKASRTRYSDYHLFFKEKESDVMVDGMDDKKVIISNRCIYFVNDSPLLDFILHAIKDLKINDDVFDILCGLICEIFFDYDNNDKQTVDKYLNSDANYLKSAFYDFFSKDELMTAIKGAGDSVINLMKYYHFTYN